MIAAKGPLHLFTITADIVGWEGPLDELISSEQRKRRTLRTGVVLSSIPSMSPANGHVRTGYRNLPKP